MVFIESNLAISDLKYSVAFILLIISYCNMLFHLYFTSYMITHQYLFAYCINVDFTNNQILAKLSFVITTKHIKTRKVLL